MLFLLIRPQSMNLGSPRPPGSKRNWAKVSRSLEGARYARMHAWSNPKGVYFKVGRDWIIDGHNLPDGRKVVYKYLDNAFCHPNPTIATSTANWYGAVIHLLTIRRLSSRIQRNIPEASATDLLELYCGNGNHSIVLSPCFRRVLVDFLIAY